MSQFPSLFSWRLFFNPTSFPEDSCNPSEFPQHGKESFHLGVCISILWMRPGTEQLAYRREVVCMYLLCGLEGAEWRPS